MTPQEVFEYKMKWMPGYMVSIHSDLRSQAVDWCKLALNPIHWKHTKFTNVYEDTFHFKGIHHAKGLVEKFPKYAKLISS